MNRFYTFLLVATFFTGYTSVAQKYGKYTLYSTMNGTTTQLIDTNNAVFKTWTHTSTSRTGYSSYLAPGGILWRSVSNQGNSIVSGGVTGRIQKLAWDGTVLWDWAHTSSTYVLHHDICPMPNGNVLVIAYDVKTPAEATQAGGLNITLWSEKIMEVKPTGPTTGDIVWEWKFWDHMVQNTNPAKDNYKPSIVNNPQLLNINYTLKKDWIHMNGLDYNPMLDQIAFSSHYLNEWYIIDHSTTTSEAASHAGGNAGKGGDLLFRWGNPAAYSAAGTQVLKVTHDAHWIPEGYPNEGRMVGFNNQGVSTNASSVDQIILPPVTDYNYELIPGTAYKPTTYTQRHAVSGYSSNMSNSQQLPNGNMLVCVATAGRMYEINPAGATIWSKTATGSVPQAFRYSECEVNSAVIPVPEISTSGDTLISSPALTYQWYRNGKKIVGATNQTYLATNTGVYVVRTTIANSCEFVYNYSVGKKLIVSLPLSVSLSPILLPICSGTNLPLEAISTGGINTTTTYSWSSIPSGFTSSISNPVVQPLVSTTYKVLAYNGLDVDSAEASVLVNPLPNTPEITQNLNELTSSIGFSYQWYFNGNIMAGQTNQTLTATQDGNYQVQITDDQNCQSALSTAINFTFTGLNRQTIFTGLTVSPNPSNSRFQLNGLQGNDPKLTAIVYDALGKTVWQSNNAKEVVLTGYSPGFYNLKLISDKGEIANFKLQLLP